jgi:hypothetical protein
MKWTRADEDCLEGMKRQYRILRAQARRMAELHRFAREKFGKDFLDKLDPAAWAEMAGHEEGHPAMRAKLRVIRCLEAVKRELQRPGGPDEEALDRARCRLSKAGEVLEQYRPPAAEG